MKEHFIQLFTYDLWANTKMIHALQEHDIGDEKCIYWMSHILNAHTIWQDRIEGRQPKLAVNAAHALDGLEEQFQAFFHSQIEWLTIIPPEKYGASVAYANSRGDQFSQTVTEILSHVINHSTHHRAQVAARLRELGVVPPPTDYIFYLRDRDAQGRLG